MSLAIYDMLSLELYRHLKVYTPFIICHIVIHNNASQEYDLIISGLYFVDVLLDFSPLIGHISYLTLLKVQLISYKWFSHLEALEPRIREI